MAEGLSVATAIPLYVVGYCIACAAVILVLKMAIQLLLFMKEHF